MLDPETALKLIVVLGAGSAVLIMTAMGIKVLFFRRRQLPGTLDKDQVDAMEDRLLRTEAKVNELEERLDFAERMLTDVRGKAQLPGKP